MHEYFPGQVCKFINDVVILLMGVTDDMRVNMCHTCMHVQHRQRMISRNDHMSAVMHVYCTGQLKDTDYCNGLIINHWLVRVMVNNQTISFTFS